MAKGKHEVSSKTITNMKTLSLKLLSKYEIALSNVLTRANGVRVALKDTLDCA